jgi:hypothetical protein
MQGFGWGCAILLLVFILEIGVIVWLYTCVPIVGENDIW